MEEVKIVSVKILFSWLLFILLTQRTDGQYGQQWCIADESATDDVLQTALDWACGAGSADCTLIQVDQPCYLPDTVKDHASYAVNDYWQNSKDQGGTCSFNGAAVLTSSDPSHDQCEFPFLI